MNPFAELINRHCSIRKYKTDPIPDDQMNRILQAALRSSSSGNMQAYSIVVTTDQDLKQQLLPAHFHQTMVTEAPVLLTFCADFHRMRQWLSINEAPENFDNFMSFMIAAIDATLAAQTAALAAEAEGLGICFMGTTLASCGEIARILKCPDYVVPVVGFSLGFPNEAPETKDRLPLEGVVHKNVYRTRSANEIAETYRKRESNGWKRYNDIPELRARVEHLGVQNLAQIYTKIKYTRESHVQYSQIVLDCLKSQGFLP